MSKYEDFPSRVSIWIGSKSGRICAYKIYWYLSIDEPIVITNIADVDKFNDVIKLAPSEKMHKYMIIQSITELYINKYSSTNLS